MLELVSALVFFIEHLLEVTAFLAKLDDILQKTR